MSQEDINKTIQTIEEEFEEHESVVRKNFFILGFVLGIPVGFILLGLVILL